MRTQSPSLSQPGTAPICVLGMHRSGTSCLAGSLQQAGLHLGKHHTWNRYNQKGNRENQDIVDFHDQLLADNNAAWNQPPRRLKITPAHIEGARAIAGSFPLNMCWGFKDPRTLLAVDVWKQVVPAIRFVGIFRHPLAVTASLQRRSAGELPDKVALELWYQYNKRLYREYRSKPFPILCFDWQEEKFHAEFNQLAPHLGLQALSPDQRFYTSELRNFDSRETAALPWKVKRLYSRLQSVCVSNT
jgi:hypothetical protein